MYNNKHFQIISAAYLVLIIILYAFVLFYLVNSRDNNYTYIIGIVLTLFFGSPMKAVYDMIFNLYFNFSDDIPEYHRTYRKVMHTVIQIISIFLTIILISLLKSHMVINLAVSLFLFGIITLSIYSGLVYNRSEKKDKDFK